MGNNNDKDLKTEKNEKDLNADNKYPDIENKKNYNLYDISNIILMILLFCSILYFIVVPIKSYNVFFILSLIISGALVGFTSFNYISDETESLFSRFVNKIYDKINYENAFELIKNTLKILFKLCKYIVIAYPCLGFFSIFVSEEFNNKYFLYPFHPNTDIISTFIFNISCIIFFFFINYPKKFLSVFINTLTKFKKNSSTMIEDLKDLITGKDIKIKYFGEISGIILLYSFYDEQLFDFLVQANSFISIILFVVFLIFLVIVFFKVILKILKVVFEFVSGSFIFKLSKWILLLPVKFFQIMVATEKAGIIGSAVPNDDTGMVEVYDGNGKFLFSKKGRLLGFDSKTVRIKGSGIFGIEKVFDKHGWRVN